MNSLSTVNSYANDVKMIQYKLVVFLTVLLTLQSYCAFDCMQNYTFPMFSLFNTSRFALDNIRDLNLQHPLVDFFILFKINAVFKHY